MLTYGNKFLTVFTFHNFARKRTEKTTGYETEFIFVHAFNLSVFLRLTALVMTSFATTSEVHLVTKWFIAQGLTLSVHLSEPLNLVKIL